MCKTATQRLGPRLESVTVGRHFVQRVLEQWGVADDDRAGRVVPGALLVATELLANAVTVASCDIEVMVQGHRSHLVVSVSDDSPQPATPRVSGRDGTDGRGLALVSALADRWGQSPFTGTRKSVWADIDLPPGSVLADDCHETERAAAPGG